MKNTEHVLIFHIGTIGDTLLTLPVFAAIRQRFPRAEITLVSGGLGGYKCARALLTGTGYINDFQKIDALKLRNLWSLAATFLKLRCRCFQYAYYLIRDEEETSRRIARDMKFFKFLGIPQIFGNCFLMDFSQKTKIHPNVTENYMERLRLSGGLIPGDGRSFDLNFSDEEKIHAAAFWDHLTPGGKIPVALGIGGKKQCCRWPLTKYAEIISKMILSDQYYPVLFGGPEDLTAGEALVRGLSAADGALCINTGLSLRETILVLARCRFYLGNDTGTIHMAAAAGIPCIGIYSSAVYDGVWYPLGTRNTVLRKKLDCAICLKPVCDSDPARCVDAISVEEVWDAVQKTGGFE